MIVHCKSGQAGVLIDRGTGKRIPLAIWFDNEAGEYEAFQLASNGVDMAADVDWKPIRYKAKAVGLLELVPLGEAHIFGWKEPQLVREPKVVKLSPDQREAGLQQYREVYTKVWQWRGESRKAVDGRWEEYLTKNTFFDDLVLTRLRRRFTPVT